MAGYTPNLDDGELWLPSDMFPDDVAPFDSHRLRSSEVLGGGLEYTSWDVYHLRRKLEMLGLLDPNQYPFASTVSPANISPHLEGFMPDFPSSYTAFDGGSGYGYGGSYGGSAANRGVSLSKNGVYRPVSSTHLPINRGKPLQAPGERYARGRIMQCLDHAPFVPSPVSGNTRRGCGGTGFFLPRVAGIHSRKKTSINKNGNSGDNQNQQNQGQEQYPTDGAVEKQAPSALGLPVDWTY